MIDHIGFRTRHYRASRAIYDAALAALGIKVVMQIPVAFTGGKDVVGYGREQPQFWLTEADSAPDGGLHIAFSARSHAEVDEFHKAALAAGARDNGAPGPRPHYHANYYGAFVLDPDGNNVEAVCHLPQ